VFPLDGVARGGSLKVGGNLGPRIAPTVIWLGMVVLTTVGMHPSWFLK
jgi:hypothetical protein